MARSRVLLTGFGPFPGAAVNPSAWLVETLAAQTPSAELDCELHARVLPTEWESVAALTPHLYEALQPHVMIHFGLSARAQSFRLERSAHNRAAPRADAKGALPGSRVILPQRPDRLDTTLPASTLAAHLKARGHEAVTSRSAGRYLCNFLYYHSLEWAARQASPRLALFVHIPHTAAQGAPLSETRLLHGAQETLRLVLDFAGELHNTERDPLQKTSGARGLASPLAGEADRSLIGREGGMPQTQNLRPTPLPDPPPQGGRELGPATNLKAREA
ncbi:MAG: pyroglutamyl-peptidase I family protein [Methyloceanibacter sp.]